VCIVGDGVAEVDRHSQKGAKLRNGLGLRPSSNCLNLAYRRACTILVMVTTVVDSVNDGRGFLLVDKDIMSTEPLTNLFLEGDALSLRVGVNKNVIYVDMTIRAQQVGQDLLNVVLK